MAIKNSAQKIRFMMVGGFNTLLDFGLLFTFKSFGLPVITSNIISTSVAFCFSFFANKKFTFKSTSSDIKREIILFIAVTLFGLWVLQTIVIQLVFITTSQSDLSENVTLLFAKVLATVISMVWNYVLYSRLVFKDTSTS